MGDIIDIARMHGPSVQPELLTVAARKKHKPEESLNILLSEGILPLGLALGLFHEQLADLDRRPVVLGIVKELLWDQIVRVHVILVVSPLSRLVVVLLLRFFVAEVLFVAVAAVVAALLGMVSPFMMH